MRFNIIFLTLFLSLSVFAQTGTYFKPPALIEGFTTTASSAGTLTLTRASQTKQIITGVTTHTVVMPDATTMSTELGRRFFIINKSSGTVTVNASGGGLLGTILGGAQAEVHLRAAGSAAGTWDLLSSSAGGGGTWGSITGTLSAQTDLQSALDLKAPLASPTFTGTITTPLTASRALVTGASSELAASAVTATEIGYVAGLTSAAQTQLDAKQARSTLTTKGDLYVATASATTARQAVGNAGEELLADPDTTNGVRYGTRVGTDNYLKANPSFEGNAVTGWATYLDAAGTQPVDCTGAGANTTFQINSSAPILNGSYQGLATLSTGATRQGEGFSYAFSIPTKYSAVPGVHQIEFDYAISGGTFVAGSGSDRTSAGDSTFTVWIYDVTNGQLIQPSTYRLLSTVGDRFVANFQNNAASTSYRLCIHKGTSATVSGANITVKFDDFLIQPAKYSFGTPITDWVSYTPTGGWTGAVTYNGKWRRVGDSMEAISQVVCSGAPTGGNLTLNLPTGYTIDTAKLPTDTSRYGLGEAVYLDAGTQTYRGNVFYNNTTSVIGNVFNASSTYATDTVVNLTAPFTFGNTDTVTVRYSVPITGWSSSVQVSDSYDGRLIAATYSTLSSTTITSGTALRFTSLIEDKTASYNTSTGAFVAPSQGTYEFTISGINTSVISDVKLFVGASDKGIFGSLASGTGRQSITIQYPLNAGDSATFVPGSSGTASDTTGWFIARKLQAPTTISATEVVAARYSTSVAQAIANATDTIVDFATKDFDTHNSVTTGGSWKYTAPSSGIYEVSGMVELTNGGGWSNVGNEEAFVSLYKNGSSQYRIGSVQAQAAHGNYVAIPLIPGMVQLNAGDYIDVRLYQSSGASLNLLGSSIANYVQVKRIK